MPATSLGLVEHCDTPESIDVLKVVLYFEWSLPRSHSTLWSNWPIITGNRELFCFVKQSAASGVRVVVTQCPSPWLVNPHAGSQSCPTNVLEALSTT